MGLKSLKRSKRYKLKTPRSIYIQVIDISTEYLGPASERFINRQVAMHLRKQPESINVHDVKELLNWLRLTFAHLTDDARLVDAYIKDLESIATVKISSSDTYEQNNR